MAETLEKKKKSKFKLPHVFILMLILLLLASILSYVIPAGEFVPDENGITTLDSYRRLEESSAVSPIDALVMILPGFVSNASTVFMVLLVGACTVAILSMKALDQMLDWLIWRFKDKGATALITAIFIALTIIGGFGGGGDLAIAYVPLGMLFAAKLKLDPPCAMAMSFLPAFIGFGFSPASMVTYAQYLSGVTLFSGFGVRLIMMGIMMAIGLAYTLIYAKRIRKKPAKSVMGNTEWLDEPIEVDESLIKEVKFPVRAFICTLFFFAQYVVCIYLIAAKGMSVAAFPAVMIPNVIICGLIMGQGLDKIGEAIANGASQLALVAVVIGLASTMSEILNSSNVMPTIVYFFCKPLAGLSTGFAAVGMGAAVTIINVFVPSASSKAVILMPILTPMAEVLNITGQVACQAFQIGDGITNICTPFFGALLASLTMCKMSWGKWFKFILPFILIMMVIGFAVLYHLSTLGWTGGNIGISVDLYG